MTEESSIAQEVARQIAVRKVGAITYRPWPAGAVAATVALVSISLFKLVAGFQPEDFLLASLLTSFFIAICVFFPYWIHQRRYNEVYAEELERLASENRIHDGVRE